MPVRSIVRLGSTTPTSNILAKAYAAGRTIIEVNTVESIENSRSKLKMKGCFANAGVPQADWWVKNTANAGKEFTYQNGDNSDNDCTVHELPYPILAKRVYGFKGKGMHKLNTEDELKQFITTNSLNGYYFEKFHNYSREYRLHTTEEGCFYGVRKMIKGETPDDKRWFRNDSNCIWVTEYMIMRDPAGNLVGYDENTPNPAFDRPVNWEQIKKDCVKALNATGLSVGAFDVKIQSAKDSKGYLRDNPKYILIEVNSAPSFGELTLKKYTEEIPKIIDRKYKNLLV